MMQKRQPRQVQRRELERDLQRCTQHTLEMIAKIGNAVRLTTIQHQTEGLVRLNKVVTESARKRVAEELFSRLDALTQETCGVVEGILEITGQEYESIIAWAPARIKPRATARMAEEQSSVRRGVDKAVAEVNTQVKAASECIIRILQETPALRAIQLPSTVTFTLEGPPAMNAVYIKLPPELGGEISVSLSGFITMRLEETAEPYRAKATVVESMYQSTSLRVGNTDFGTLQLVEDPEEPSIGTVNLKTGEILLNEVKLVHSPQLGAMGLKPVKIRLTSRGCLSPLSLSGGCAALTGVSAIPQTVPLLGRAVILAVSAG